MSFVRDFLRPGDLFVDVGANVGTYSLLAAATQDLEILAYEPSTVAFTRFEENIDLNGLRRRVLVRQVAVGARSGRATVSTGLDAINHILGPDETTAGENVLMASLDELIGAERRHAVSLVKVDVEGFEEHVLRGASVVLAEAHPVLIVEANDPSALRSVLEPLGYRPCGYDPIHRQLEDISWLDIRGNNLLAVCNRPLVEARLSNRNVPLDVGEPAFGPKSTSLLPLTALERSLPGPNDDVSPPPPYASHRDRRVGRRVLWMTTDQALSSSSNIVTAIIAARSLDAAGFGAFGLTFVIYTLVIGSVRGLVTEPLISLHSDDTAEALRPVFRAATGSAIALGTTAAIPIAIAGAILGGASGVALGGLAIMLPGLVLQDAWRYCFVASGRPQAATLNDATWCAIQAILFVVLVGIGHLTLLSIVLWWGGSGVLAGVIGCAQATMIPRLWSTRAWIRRHSDLSWRYLTEFAVATGSSQVTLIALGAIAGLAALGAVRGALVFFGPIVVLFGGVFLALAADGARLKAQPRKLRRLMVYSSSILIVVGLLSLLLGLTLPDHIGRRFFGHTWTSAQHVLVPVGLAVIGNCASAGAVVGLRALAAARASLRARLIAAPLTVAAPIVGTVYGARGFAVGLAVASWTSAVIWWRQFRRALPADADPSRPLLEGGNV